ncbi:hypothetical protein CK203_055840 [Vitis vinifera]|uniref:Uncharacterized protein n=1 Tax=Vitis vinifera TaxID=29760 RepID=A0A438H6N3_VITVI|nr:hypothetical protein CK203_055840 [Vitis vinifera]
MQRAGLKRFLDLNELEEMRNEAYMNSKISKDKLKRWHDQIVLRKEFQEGQKVLLYDSKLHIFPGKLKSRWNGPYLVHKAYSNGVVEITNPKNGCIFKVNGHRLKPYMEPMVQEKEELTFLTFHKLSIPGFSGWMECMRQRKRSFNGPTPVCMFAKGVSCQNRGVFMPKQGSFHSFGNVQNESLSQLHAMGNQKRKSSDIEKEFVVMNDGNGEDMIPNHLRDFPSLNLPFLDIETRGMSQDLQWIKENQRWLLLWKITGEETKRQSSNSFKFSGIPCYSFKQHAVVQSTVAKAPAPTPVTKSAPPPSRPPQFQFTKAPKKKLATGAREDCSGRKFHEECYYDFKAFAASSY